MSLQWLQQPAKPVDISSRDAAAARQDDLTKPRGALGGLEALAIQLAGLQARPCPAIDRVHITVFAADHGIASAGVSAYPQVVTGEMVRNFASGGAAISVLARQLAATLDVVNLGTVNDPGEIAGVRRAIIAPSTANFLDQAAMSDDQLVRALDEGAQAVRRAQSAGSELFIGGEMGIGNTTAATALACVLLEAGPPEITGAGTGLDEEGVRHKAEIIARAVAFHRGFVADPLEALRRLGGFEIAALVGSYVSAAQHGIVVLVDGFISSVAALAAVAINPGCREWMLFAHRSAERGHQRVLDALAANPLLDLGMRLGEGSGAALAVPIVRLACALARDMATFSQAGVSNRD
ncbi:nicotinate-nucleotide--dimethylbenzimidazole phosphoribosyltransferase [Tahibacter amnicola]|uniref:Nicotinate-nucleotide--dimethylbenzimidazole phosphoribosyltransferase n=1 Tax=Tahibacter amnicola TaxID=2976241 RepID=A0ABY6B9K8_9GAMM|nr:nicotinate-nucleotide--dimethylbenzimidazole phosphoribosyltransferase [Tahibacter amnicola]UXI66540.1 nicotinate-nucleotide--dimethylbenzimidazole phosphoribosyltransferase [Tahibacter amnicola]